MSSPRSRGRASAADLGLALFVLLVVAMMIVPLPTPLIDLLIALNLGLGIVILAAALYLRDALAFTVFPTLLLLSTLYRLALHVSSTRLILLQADAGQVIEAFGHFVVRGDYRVGALVFAMLTLVQFLVIARGAERVAEVAARFSLDGLPGRQLAIDAELRAGTLRPEAARAMRERLTQESQLYGALDGALKFVKGDAIATIAITALNFVGGVAIGVFTRDLPLSDSLRTYGLLTIGDGLVTQIPALLAATSAGLVVTRVGSAGDGAARSLAAELERQLLRDPRALAVGIAVLCALALIPSLPAWPFLTGGLIGAVLLGASGGARGRRDDGRSRATPPLTLELSPALATRFPTRPWRASPLTSLLERVCERLHDELGLEVATPLVRAAPGLPARSLRFVFRGLPSPVTSLSESELPEPAIGAACERWLRRHAADCLSIDELQQRIDNLARERPTLVRTSMPAALTTPLLHEVLRALLREQVSIAHLDEILAAIAPHAERNASAEKLTEQARRALAPRITHALAPEGKLHLLRLSPEVEETLLDGVRAFDDGERLTLPYELEQELVEAVLRVHEAAPRPCALLTQSALRRHVRALLSEPAPQLPVVSSHELTAPLLLTNSAPIGP